MILRWWSQLIDIIFFHIFRRLHLEIYVINRFSKVDLGEIARPPYPCYLSELAADDLGPLVPVAEKPAWPELVEAAELVEQLPELPLTPDGEFVLCTPSPNVEQKRNITILHKSYGGEYCSLFGCRVF